MRALRGFAGGLLLLLTLAACADPVSVVPSSDDDQGRMVLHASAGGVTFWLFRDHDREGRVCYGFATGDRPPTEKVDTGGICLDENFSVFEADPITAPTAGGTQMAIGGAISEEVARVEVTVSGVSYDAEIRHGFYLAAVPYGDFIARAFDSHGRVLSEANRPRPPTSIPTPRLSPPPASPPSP